MADRNPKILHIGFKPESRAEARGIISNLSFLETGIMLELWGFVLECLNKSNVKLQKVSNGILLPSLQPALPLLDLHKVPRLEFHQSVLDEMKERMISRIKEIAAGPDKGTKYRVLNELLNKCMPVIKVKLLRPVVMCLMQYLPKIKSEHLQIVVSNKELYDEAAVEVKQQIWEGDQSLFGEEVSPLLRSYVEMKESTLLSMDSPQSTFFQTVPKLRRQTHSVQEVVRMVGKNTHLYEMILQFLRTIFLRTQNVHYCTFRSELLMSLHDREVSEILADDPCHKFTWCLDACIREKFVDSKRAKELLGLLDAVKWSQEHVLGDLSMVLCDPQSIHTIAASIIKNLTTCINNESLPRANEDVVILVRLLCMGLKAWKMIDSRLFKEPKLDVDLITRFLPCLSWLMADDQLAVMSGKTNEQLDPAPSYLLTSCDDVSAVLLCHYALHVTKQGWTGSIVRVVSCLSEESVSEVAYSNTFLHDFVSHLISFPEMFATPEFCSAIFDKFFKPQCSQDSVCKHLIRLLLFTHHKVHTNSLSGAVEMLQNLNSVQLQSLLDGLSERVRTYNEQQVQLQLQQQQQQQQQSIAASNELLDSPFVSTPLSSILS
ncbi:hypothetical protein HELRODRAFT_193409 [Helobdella robusta]|uniref:Negative elongation factor B n=1 Tax=Helobdella robusta TaxID=6412 RepID=T1FUY8_HELRO|nr:hypothetical protein HELRODRAFT_193409 [Helobdella robusta]ESN96950.1 hypothetical protein HELRODRAFT_193409 [Helobdella robusta]